ncbi:MAG TPA: ATP-binding protein [Acidimicrobiales bacterium]|nr:ATP-binding protein [Acidimicrobiales bacterium]
MLRRARMAFGARNESISTARHFAVGTARAWGYPSMGDDVALLVSELVTNAVRHTDDGCSLEMTEMARGVHVEVHDCSTVEPTVGRGGPGDESGRGIRLVQQLASAWGVRRRRGGKAVWFELAGAPG